MDSFSGAVSSLTGYPHGMPTTATAGTHLLEAPAPKPLPAALVRDYILVPASLEAVALLWEEADRKDAEAAKQAGSYTRPTVRASLEHRALLILKYIILPHLEAANKDGALSYGLVLQDEVLSRFLQEVTGELVTAGQVASCKRFLKRLGLLAFARDAQGRELKTTQAGQVSRWLFTAVTFVRRASKEVKQAVQKAKSSRLRAPSKRFTPGELALRLIALPEVSREWRRLRAWYEDRGEAVPAYLKDDGKFCQAVHRRKWLLAGLMGFQRNDFCLRPKDSPPWQLPPTEAEVQAFFQVA